MLNFLDIQVLLSKKIYNTKVNDITIDLIQLFFLKKLILKDLDMIFF